MKFGFASCRYTKSLSSLLVVFKFPQVGQSLWNFISNFGKKFGNSVRLHHQKRLRDLARQDPGMNIGDGVRWGPARAGKMVKGRARGNIIYAKKNPSNEAYSKPLHHSICIYIYYIYINIFNTFTKIVGIFFNPLLNYTLEN